MLLLFSYKVISNSEIPWIAASQASLSFTVSQSLLRFRSIESMMLSNHLILWYCLLLLHLIFPSIGVFSNELPLCIRWPKDYSGLISFRIDWFDLLAVQGILKSSSTPQFESISSLALSLPYGPTLTPITDCWTNHNFDYIWTFVGKVISLLLNTCLGLT